MIIKIGEIVKRLLATRSRSCNVAEKSSQSLHFLESSYNAYPVRT